MPWAPFLTRRKQSVVMMANQNARLMSAAEPTLWLKYRFSLGGFLVNTGTMTAPTTHDITEGIACEE